jgi:putative ABC transport system permease protein
MLKSFWRLQQVAPGFNAQGALTLELNMPPTKYAKPEQRAAHLQQALERLQALPGVTFAGATHRLPLRGNSASSFQIEGRPAFPTNQRPSVNFRAVTPDYFKAMGTPLVAGRTFTAEEAWQRTSAVIINQTLARQYWPNENPLGSRLRFGNPNNPPLEIIGVAADVKENELNVEAQSGIYVPYSVSPSAAMTLVLRTESDALRLAAAASAAVRQVDVDQAVSGIQHAGRPGQRVGRPAAFQYLVVSFIRAAGAGAGGGGNLRRDRLRGGAAYVGDRLAYGVRRTGARYMAVGVAARRQAGALWRRACLGGAWALTSYLKSLLFGVSPTDPLLFALTAASLFLLALLACWIPARRATKVDPMIALRCE